MADPKDPQKLEHQAIVGIDQDRGLVPRDIEDLWRLATMFAKSDLVPRDYRDKPGNVAVAVQYGLEVGLKPMQAVQNITAINGRPALWGDAGLALAWRSGLMESIAEMDLADIQTQKRAVCTIVRKGSGPVTRTFTLEDAQRAKLWGKAGPWTEYWPRMMQMRARWFALRDALPDVLKGMVGVEELVDGLPPEPRNVTPTIVPVPTTQEPLASQPQAREAEITIAEPPAESEPAAPALPAPELVPLKSPAAQAAAASPPPPAPMTDPLSPPAPDAALTTEVMWAGKSIRTGGVTALTLARLVTCARKFDRAHHPGAANDAGGLCLKRALPSLYHCTENEGQHVLAHLAEVLKAIPQKK